MGGLRTTATGGGYNGTITLLVKTYECAKCHTTSLSQVYKNVLCNISQEFQSSLCKIMMKTQHLRLECQKMMLMLFDSLSTQMLNQ